MAAGGRHVEVRLLGRFGVTVDDRPVPDAAWRRRLPTALVKLLALEPGHALHREQVMDRLWPELGPEEAAPRLHKAAHFARRALDDRGGVVLSGDRVALLPGADVAVDVPAFVAAADIALSGDVPGALDEALARYSGELLPDDRYEPWAEAARERLALLHQRLLRKAGRWDELVAADPTDEAAHLGLMRQLADRGDRAGALAQFDLLARALERELGARPGPDAVALRDHLAAAPDAPPSTPARSQVVRFCRTSDGFDLAYATVGRGPPLVKAASWLTHLEYDWESIVWRHWLDALSDRHLLVRYDARGSGLSSWDVPELGLDAWVRDLEAVVDALGLEAFPLLGISQGAAVAVSYAARHPERVTRLVLYGGYVHGAVRRATTEAERRAAELRPVLAELGWGSADSAFRQVFTTRFMPEGTKEQWAAFDELQARTTSPANAAAFMRATATIDVEEVARQVRAPTLVLHARGDRHPPLAQARLLATAIPDSRLVTLDSQNHLLLADEPAWARFLAELHTFLADG